MAYTYPINGSTYHLIIHRSIEIPHLYHHLLCPIHHQVNGVMINDTPKFLTDDPTPQTHAIVIDIEDSDAGNYNLILTLSLKIVTSYLPVHKPTKEEWESKTYPRLKRKSEHLDRDPNITWYTEQEEAMTYYRGEIEMYETSSRGKYLAINSLSIVTVHSNS